jgi:type III secretion protein R
MKSRLFFYLVSFFVMSPVISWAQSSGVQRLLHGGGGTAAQGISQPLVLMLVLIALVLLPIVAMMTTSFVKLVVVLSMLRNALGTQQVPPTPIITGLSLILTIYIMTPVGIQMFEAAETSIKHESGAPLMSQASVNLLLEAVDQAKEPMRNFLKRHTHAAEQKLFYDLARTMMANKRNAQGRDEIVDPSKVPKSSAKDKDSDAKQSVDVTPNDFMILVPAFVISELTEAFQIAFIIFLPFLIIDIVVTNILLALGMFMVPPVTMSLPIKLLLFVMVDGWLILTRALLMGYM